MQKAAKVIAEFALECYPREWCVCVMDEFTEFGVWVCAVGPFRLVRRWEPA